MGVGGQQKVTQSLFKHLALCLLPDKENPPDYNAKLKSIRVMTCLYAVKTSARARCVSLILGQCSNLNVCLNHYWDYNGSEATDLITY